MNISHIPPNDLSLKWQHIWRESGVFSTRTSPEKPRYYGYEYPPFPSGSLHMGHVRNYVIGDTLARYKRLRGYNILYTQAFDSLGLPVEDAARKSGMTPAQWLENCIADMTAELLQLGLSYDQAKIYSYHDPDYYKWTQWIFLKLHEAGAIYRAQSWSDWCDSCKTALAFEQVEEGCCWRCGTQTTKTRQPQWYIDVQSIAPDLLAGLEHYNFPKAAKTLQRNWIGRLPGLFVDFQLEGQAQALKVFTTRPDLIYGTSFLGLAPEHPAIPTLIKGAPDEARLLATVQDMCTLPRVERMKAPEREGLFLNQHAIHPLTGELVPLYVTPFVQQDLGTGAILGCPSHDTNSFRFAKTMGIVPKPVLALTDGTAPPPDHPYCDDGILVDSGPYSDMSSAAARAAITQDLIQSGTARTGETFRVRDWCISRQRYWSCPIPIVHCPQCGPVPVATSDLPVTLPTEGVDLNCNGNPLEHHAEFLAADCPACGATARREASTLDTFVNSSWSYMRNCNPDHHTGFCDTAAVEYWVPSDLDIGGTENITVANFYFRVVLQWLHRLGLTSASEPFKSSIFHGMVLMDGRKMSKSVGNTIRPQDLIRDYGVDAVRFHSMWAARPENDYNWSDEKAAAAQRFLSGVWQTSIDIIQLLERPVSQGSAGTVRTKAEKSFARQFDVGRTKIERSYDTAELQAACNALILLQDKVKKYLGKLQTQTQVTAQQSELLRQALRGMLIMLNPIAPHLTEELWLRMGNSKMLAEHDHWEDMIHAG